MRALTDSMALLVVGTDVAVPGPGSIEMNMVCSRMRRRMVSRALTSRWCRLFSLPSAPTLFWSRKSLWRISHAL